MTEALDALIEENERARAELLDALDALPAERRVEGWFGPEAWSAKDILAHIARWQGGWAHALGLVASGERPSIPEFEPNREDPEAADNAFNAESVARSGELSWEQVLANLRDARERHNNAIRGLAVLEPDRYAEGRTPYRLADAAEHDREHAEAILAWRGEQGV
ncbi:MAG: DinB family protein [Chloroflexi bacterium]|nr:DinB family protein [Chloroflexota bacterium]